MNKIIKYTGIAGFIICFIIMHTTNLGEKGLRKYDSDFRLLDMKFHYTADDVSKTFENLGENGIAAYQNFWIIDFFFIVCYLIVMINISSKITIQNSVKNILIILSIAGPVFDAAENCILIYLSCIYPVLNNLLVILCSWATIFKFVMIFMWAFGFVFIKAMPIIKLKFTGNK